MRLIESAIACIAILPPRLPTIRRYHFLFAERRDVLTSLYLDKFYLCR